jgi:hypothetical protein
MNYSLGNMLGGSNGSLNPDKLSLNLQFATDKTLTARKGPTPTFTRASTATFVGSDGLIQSAAINAARFDHDPVTLASKGLLIEESRTNLLQRSEEFDNATYWSLVRTTVSADQTASPTGNTTADKLITDSSVVNNHRIDRSSITLALNTVYTISVFAKASEYSGFAMGVDSSSPVLGVQFSLSGSGSVTAQLAGYTGTIQNFGNGWFRCTATFTSSAVLSTHRVYMYLGQNGTTFTYTGDGTSGIFIWGAQLEAGSFPTSYIPTTTASVVRSVDVCSITGSAFTGFYNQSEGTFFVEADPRATTANATYLMANSGANTNQVSIFRTTTISTFGVASGGAFTAQITTASANGSFNKIAGSYFTNDARAAFNGVLGTADTTVNVPTNLTRLNLGSGGTGSTEIVNGCISSIRYFKKRLSNAKLQTLTT